MDPRTTYDRRADVQLVDVREQNEWDAGHIEGAVHIPMDRVPQRLDDIDRDRQVVTVCRSGHRSGQVAEYLNRAGYSASNLDGGLEQWQSHGLPLTGSS